MRIGFVELLLILLIASLTIGPSAALWVDRWLRRANRASAAAARRRAVQEAQRAAEREEVLQRFQKLSILFTLAAAAALVWALVLRPIDGPAQNLHRSGSPAGLQRGTGSAFHRPQGDLGSGRVSGCGLHPHPGWPCLCGGMERLLPEKNAPAIWCAPTAATLRSS